MSTEADTTIAALGLPSVESVVVRVQDTLPWGVDFYTCDDAAESLTHERVADAVGGYVEDRVGQIWEPNEGPPEIEVCAWRRGVVSDADYEAASIWAAEKAIECLEEDHGGDTGRPEVLAAEKALAAALVPLIREHYPQSLSWRCEQAGKPVTLTEEEAWSVCIYYAGDDERAAWAEAAKAWLAEPKDGAA